MTKKIAILGNSGHAFVVLETSTTISMNIAGYFDKQPVANNPFHLNYLGFEGDNLVDLIPYQFIIGIGDNTIRKRAFNLILERLNVKPLIDNFNNTTNSDISETDFSVKNELNTIFINIIDASTNLSPNLKLGSGNYIGKNVCVNSMATIGHNCILNTGSIIEHECHIENHSHIAPGSVILGNVRIGSTTLIGANSTVLPGLVIGDNVTVGAGSVVTKNIPNGGKWIGNRLVN